MSQQYSQREYQGTPTESSPFVDFDQARFESIKIEQNSKGVNISVRTVRSERESQEEWRQRTISLYRQVQTEVGR